MSKKLIAFILAVAMMFCILAMTGCDEEVTLEAETRIPTTLSVVGITEESTTPEAVKAVEAALNEITIATYKTKIELTLVTMDEYYDLIDRKTAEAKANMTTDAAVSQYNTYMQKLASEAQAAASRNPVKIFGFTVPNNIKAETVTTRFIYSEEATTVDEDGIVSTVYPDPASPIDVVMILGKDMYEKFDTDGLLLSIQSLLSSTTGIADYKKIMQYVYPTYFSQLSAITGDIKAVPTNNLLAEYTYLLVKRDIADKYDFDINLVSGYGDIEGFLSQIKEGETGVVPMSEVPGPLGIYYPFGENVAIASYFDPINGYNEKKSFSVMNLFDIPQYKEYLTLMEKYKEAGYIADGDAAVMTLKGDASIEAVYGDEYYTKIIQNPFIEEDAIFNGMMAVSSYTSSDARSLELIQAINTDTRLKNLLQYGINGVNYSVNEDGKTIKRLNNDYMMNTALTGDVYTGYPEEGQIADQWKYYKTTNLASSLSPFLIYYIDSDVLEQQLEAILSRAALSEALKPVGVTYEQYMAVQGTVAGTNYMIALKKLYKDYLSTYLRTVELNKSSDENINKLVTGGEVNTPGGTSYVKLISDKIISEKYSDIITGSGLKKLINEKMIELVTSYAQDTKNNSYKNYKYDTYNSEKEKAANYNTYVSYLRVMSKMLIFSELSAEENEKYDAMSDSEFEIALREYVKSTYIKENNLTEADYEKLVKETISSALSFNDYLGGSYSITWSELEKTLDDSKDFINAVETLKTVYADILSAAYYNTDSANATPVAVAEKIHDLLYQQYLKDNGLSMGAFQTSIYDELLAPYNITKVELDKLRTVDKKTYESYINKLKSQYKDVLLKTYSLERYSSTEYKIDSADILSVLLNHFIEEKTNIYHTMAEKANISYDRFTEGKKSCTTYIMYVNQMRTINIYTLTSFYTESEVSNFKYNEIQDKVYNIFYDTAFYSNEMVKLVGVTLRTYMTAKSNAAVFTRSLRMICSALENELKAEGYTADMIVNMKIDEAEEIINGIIEKKYFSDVRTLESIIEELSGSYLDEMNNADDIKSYCEKSSKELNDNYIYSSIVSTFADLITEKLAELDKA